ncbi:MAG TPA: chemotaxis protein CheA [Bryobacteraceae bacterium]|nr:chemotaxis protein CheA [Bryobacteraceae bacterium]
MAAELEPKTECGAGTMSPPAGNPLASDPELLNDFILEAREHLTSIELQLLTLDQDPANAEAIHAVFRGFHTIKGMAGFLDLDAVRDVSHEVETILDLARNAQLAITPKVIDAILASKDYLSHWMGELEAMLQSGRTPEADDNRALIETIRGVARGSARPETAAAAEPVRCESAEPADPPGAEALVAEAPHPPAAPVEGATSGLLDLAREVAVQPAEAAEAPKPAEPAAVVARSIKVDTAKLDYLVDMVGEMVIAQSMVRHDPDLTTGVKPRLARNLSQLARITDEVQRTAMSMRMIPIGQLFQKTARLVRDLSRKASKQVDLELSGEDTELDRNIVEELADPLMHMVRNAVDHGIETPEDRLKAGKPPNAKVLLKAAHQAGHILIQISDDGRGLDRERILRKAREKGLIEPEAQLSEAEIFNLIFLPGFSTAEKITDVSGRGVGMDVVRKHLQKLRGRVDVHSRPGAGTTFLMKLPLTLAIIDGLVVGVGSQRYIVPIFAVREMLKPTADAISTIRGREEMAMVRGTLLPLIRLHRRFGIDPRFENPWDSLLIVSENGGKQFCLMVDELIGKQEVVIKSLGEAMQNIPGVAGGAILGDGRVGLILDLEGLFGASQEAVSGGVLANG